MSIIPQLASSQKRADEQPNIDLAEAIVQRGDSAAVQELITLIGGKDKPLVNDSIKVLYEIGERQPELIAPYAEAFVRALKTRNNRLTWGAMTALGQIVPHAARILVQHLNIIKTATTNGSVITQDWGVRVLAGIAQYQPDHAPDVMPYLFDFLRNCRPKDLPRHAESVLPAVSMAYRAEFLQILNHRKTSLRASPSKRVDKVIKQVSGNT